MWYGTDPASWYLLHNLAFGDSWLVYCPLQDGDGRPGGPGANGYPIAFNCGRNDDDDGVRGRRPLDDGSNARIDDADAGNGSFLTFS